MKKNRYTLSEGFVKEALESVGRNVITDLGNGHLRDIDDYYAIAAGNVWDNLVYLKNSDSDYSKAPLSALDIAAGCRRYGLAYHISGSGRSKSKIYLSDEGFIFEFATHILSGGPTNSAGTYSGHHGCEYRFSIRTMMNLIIGFRPAFEVMKPMVEETVKMTATEYRESRIMAMTVRAHLEPGLEDIPYRYRCMIEDGRGKVCVWLYQESNDIIGPDDIIQFTFRYEELLVCSEIIKDAIRAVSADLSKYEDYSNWITFVFKYDDDVPGYSEKKMA